MNELNPQQEEAAYSKERTILCLAGAGCGKTKTLLARIERLIKEGVDPRSILALTFTNAAAFEMANRYKQIPGLDLTKGNPEFRTFHGFCYSLIVKDKNVRERLGYSKIPAICEDTEMKEIKTRVKLAIGCKLTDAQLDNDVHLSRSQQEEKKLFQKAVIKEIKKENIITFDIMCYNVCELFEKHDECIEKYRQQYKYIIIDEFQDTDRRQFQFASSFPETTNFWFCADALQCQPTGTKIYMCDDKIKNIEDIVVGDKVVNYSRDGYYNVKSRHGGIVSAVGKRFASNIVEVRSAFHSSRYTKDHLTYCKIHYEGNENKKCIYLMCNSSKGWWRIGTCSLFISNGSDFGPKGRMHAEKGDKVWILDICSTEGGQSWLVEQTAAFKFGIPDTTWEFANTHNYYYTEESLSELYASIPDIEERARRCLDYYGRDINYPFYDKAWGARIHMSKKHLFEIRVGNLIPHLMDIAVPKQFVESTYDNKRLHTTYEEIQSVTECDPDWVYSLNVSTHHNYVADGILTHNCIYQFRGTSNEYVKKLATAPGWHVVKLYKNYRSTKQICNFANKFSKYAKDEYRIEMEGSRDGDEPEVIYGSNSSYDCPVDEDHLEMLIKKIKSRPIESAILCRSNRECAAVRSALSNAGIEFTSRSKSTDALDILKSALSNEYMLGWLSTKLEAKQYGDYIRLVAQNDNPDIRWFLSTYGSYDKIKRPAEKVIEIRNITCNKLLPPKEKFEQIAKVVRSKSKCEFKGDDNSTNKEIVESIIDQITELQEAQVYCGTVHSVKGLEYEAVYVMGVNDTMFPLGTEEMNNLYYVAITRAKNYLTVFRR